MKRYFLLFLLVIPLILYSQIEIKETFYSVSVVGAVEYPGVYRVAQSSRLSEALTLASRAEMEYRAASLKLQEAAAVQEMNVPMLDFNDRIQIPEQEIPAFSTRNITLKRQQQEFKIDLEKFFRLGDQEQNPYLLEGDIILVPPQQGYITLAGAVNRTGKIELLPEETLQDIIRLALGFRQDAELSAIELIRYSTDGTEFHTILINYNSSAENSKDCLLQSGDRIYVRSIPNYFQEKTVTVFGEVLYPGEYLIHSGKTTLLEILKQAGGFTSSADPNNAFLQRRTTLDLPDPEFERLKLISPAEMTYLEYEYFKMRVRDLKGKFALDFQLLWEEQPSANDILLQQGDFIYIPEHIGAVAVSGQVRNPGMITYIPDQDVSYYIEKAGGLGWHARENRIRLIRAGTGEWIKPDKTTRVLEGDLIFVPEKEEIKYWQVFRETVVVLSQIATLYLVIQNVSQ